MFFNSMFVQNDIVGTAMNGSVLRNEVIQNNIANADIPGYKKKVVYFENSLQSAIETAQKKGRLELQNAAPKISAVNTGFNYRIDKNNVDIETEMVELYQNSVKYDTMVSSVINNYKRISLALSK